jgi:FlaA1/EpsC-like NDP-sugar epimerase
MVKVSFLRFTVPPNGNTDTSVEKATPPNVKGSRGRKSSEDKAKETEISGIVSGKNVFITGGAAGLGYTFFNHFLQFGANVI